ncbi:hypothetical protein DM860_010160 [Cuscuta australis]|uniref:Uncharacterized protein n=1 Tax=Cuscuta australis TaxID=267555 RepID=A0A328D746_9ASTE|nr:hypothetical protein DM860_010160 [Cuscuta australis]
MAYTANLGGGEIALTSPKKSSPKCAPGIFCEAIIEAQKNLCPFIPTLNGSQTLILEELAHILDRKHYNRYNSIKKSPTSIFVHRSRKSYDSLVQSSTLSYDKIELCTNGSYDFLDIPVDKDRGGAFLDTVVPVVDGCRKMSNLCDHEELTFLSNLS